MNGASGRNVGRVKAFQRVIQGALSCGFHQAESRGAPNINGYRIDGMGRKKPEAGQDEAKGDER